jgi:leucyl-tRNA synthetase
MELLNAYAKIDDDFGRCARGQAGGARSGDAAAQPDRAACLRSALCRPQTGPDGEQSGLPEADASALVQDEIELVLQVNGKLRGSLRVAAGADRATIEAAALACEAACRQLAGAAPRKVVVVPGRLVNIVV